MSKTHIETASGDYFDFWTADPANVHIEDIASSLSKLCRFNGHVRKFYSVAEHALLVRRLVIHMGQPAEAFKALHHDSPEAFYGDVTTPLKAMLDDRYTVIRDRVDGAVGEALGVDLLTPSWVIKYADQWAMRAEARALKTNAGQGLGHGADTAPSRLPAHLRIRCLPPKRAERLFLEAHYDEMSRRVGR